jgi:hypothetical protein
MNQKQAKQLRKAAKEIAETTDYTYQEAYKAAKRAFNKLRG